MAEFFGQIAWTPGIGDPTITGWLAVAFYIAAASASARARHRIEAKHERRFWTALTIGLAALALNKQLDLQSAVTDIARVSAHEWGWYKSRRAVQLAFVAAVLAVTAAVSVSLAILLRRSPPGVKVSALGTSVLLAFVAIRATSFHRMDALIGTDVIGIRMNAVLELGSLVIIAAGAVLRLRHLDQTSSAAPYARMDAILASNADQSSSDAIRSQTASTSSIKSDGGSPANTG